MMRALRALQARQAGLSLIELLIAIMLTGLLMTLGVWMFVAGTHSVSLAQSIDGGTRQASNWRLRTPCGGPFSRRQSSERPAPGSLRQGYSRERSW